MIRSSSDVIRFCSTALWYSCFVWHSFSTMVISRSSSTASSCGRHRASLESRCRTDSTNNGSFGKVRFRIPAGSKKRYSHEFRLLSRLKVVCRQFAGTTVTAPSYYRGFRWKVYGDNTTKYAQNHWNLSKVFTERGRFIIMNVQISTSGCVLCVCGEKTVLPRKEIPKNTQDTTVNLS